jgi:hypothetical protein
MCSIPSLNTGTWRFRGLAIANISLSLQHMSVGDGPKRLSGVQRMTEMHLRWEWRSRRVDEGEYRDAEKAVLSASIDKL